MSLSGLKNTGFDYEKMVFSLNSDRNGTVDVAVRNVNMKFSSE